MTPQRLDDFGDAWNAGNLDLIMNFFAEDCVYHASVGPEPGESFIGPTAVRRGIATMLERDDGGISKSGDTLIVGDKGIAEWRYEYPQQDGSTHVVRGCDIFEFRGDLIVRKDAFRKSFPLDSSRSDPALDAG